MAGDSLPPPHRPQRQLDTVSLEGLDDLVAADAPGRELLKSRDFPELNGLDVSPSDIKVVLFDVNSVDSLAACVAARMALGENARYEGVDRGTAVEDLTVNYSGEVVAMLGIFWSLEAMHDLVTECDWLLICETHTSVTHELQQFSYPNAVPILEPGMGAGALAWNMFFPNVPVPPLMRYLEDAELGRDLLRSAAAFADGFQAAFPLTPSHGKLLIDDPVFEEFELLLDGGGRSTIDRAIEEGLLLRTEIQKQCEEAAEKHVVRTLREFPAWRCALVNMSTPFAGRVAEHLAAKRAAEDGESDVHRCFAAVFEVKRRHVRVVLRSVPQGADVSEIAAQYDGSGSPTRAFFSVPIELWEELWVQPEPVLWDTAASAPQCLSLKCGDLVTVSQRGQRFNESPFDEWSWGYKNDAASEEGWIPTLAHTLLVATKSAPSSLEGIKGVDEGDMLIAQGQRGQYLWGSTFHPGQVGEGSKGWFPYLDSIWQPVHVASVQGLLARGGA